MTSRRSLPFGSCGLRLSDAPQVSVVVASAADLGTLRACLRVLVPACTARAVEVVVARACDTEEFRGLQREWPQALWMPAPDGSKIGALKAAGLSAAEGDIVALIHDEQLLGDAWVAELAEGPRRTPPEP